MEDKSDDLEALVEKLIESGERLSADIRSRLLAFGAATVPALIRVLEDEELALSTARGGGYAPVHAAELLGELRAPEAVEPMLRVLSRTDFMDVLHDRLLTAMPAIGAPVVEPALRAARYRTSARSASAMASSIRSMHFAATSRSMTMGGLILRMCPAGIQASPLRKAAW